MATKAVFAAAIYFALIKSAGTQSMNQFRLLAIAVLLLFPVTAARAVEISDKVAAKSAEESSAIKPGTAQMGTPHPPSEAQKELADHLIEAVNSKDPSKLRALIAPKSQQCLDRLRQPYLDEWFKGQFRFAVDKDSEVTVAELAGDSAAKSTPMTPPLAPTHVLTISSGQTSRPRVLRRLIREQDGKWLLVVGCPNQETLEKFTALRLVKARAVERADKLMPNLKEPLTSEIQALVAKGDRMGAARLCAERLNTDPLAARVLVDRISREKNH